VHVPEANILRFSVFAGPPVQTSEIGSLESQARYITQPVLAMDALEKQADYRLVMETPPDPKTGAASIELDPLAWIHHITSHIPDPGRHCQRFYGAYSNRGRISAIPADGENDDLPAALPGRDNSDVSREARSTWARLIKKIFETDPLLCTHALVRASLSMLLNALMPVTRFAFHMCHGDD
jgi:hypothetical protein